MVWAKYFNPMERKICKGNDVKFGKMRSDFGSRGCTIRAIFKQRLQLHHLLSFSTGKTVFCLRGVNLVQCVQLKRKTFEEKEITSTEQSIKHFHLENTGT